MFFADFTDIAVSQHTFSHEEMAACPVLGCKFTTKRLADYRRHWSGKHDMSTPRFLCPVLGCTYIDKGFRRKDKLKSHIKNKHPTMPSPAKIKSLTAIKPKD